MLHSLHHDGIGEVFVDVTSYIIRIQENEDNSDGNDDQYTVK